MKASSSVWSLTGSTSTLTTATLVAAACGDGLYLIGGWALPEIAAFWLLNLYLAQSAALLPLLLQRGRRAPLGLLAMVLAAASLGARLGTTAALDPPGPAHLLLIGAAVLSAGAVGLDSLRVAAWRRRAVQTYRTLMESRVMTGTTLIHVPAKKI